MTDHNTMTTADPQMVSLQAGRTTTKAAMTRAKAASIRPSYDHVADEYAAHCWGSWPARMYGEEAP
jgi:hypothetical protein